MSNEFLRAVLGCTMEELKILEDLEDKGVDLFIVVGNMKDAGKEISFKGIINELFVTEIKELKGRIEYDIEYGKNYSIRLKYLEEGEEWQKARLDYVREFLKVMEENELDPEEDFEYHINSSGVFVTCDPEKKKFYDKYFGREVKIFANFTGFNVEPNEEEERYNEENENVVF